MPWQRNEKQSRETISNVLRYVQNNVWNCEAILSSFELLWIELYLKQQSKAVTRNFDLEGRNYEQASIKIFRGKEDQIKEGLRRM